MHHFSEHDMLGFPLPSEISQVLFVNPNAITYKAFYVGAKCVLNYMHFHTNNKQWISKSQSTDTECCQVITQLILGETNIGLIV